MYLLGVLILATALLDVMRSLCRILLQPVTVLLFCSQWWPGWLYCKKARCALVADAAVHL
jgi:hypothetical protein